MSKKKKRQVSKGTGKRFESEKKIIHEPSRKMAPATPYWEEKLRQRLEKFAHGDRFANDFFRALGLYFEDENASPQHIPDINEDEILSFMEWYINDYISLDGRRLLDIYVQEHGHQLNAQQRAQIERWNESNTVRLVEFLKVEPGVGVIVKDLLSGEKFDVIDYSASYGISRWAIGLFRLHDGEDRLSFTGEATVLSPKYKQPFLDKAQPLWDAYQKQHSGTSISDFYRKHSLELVIIDRRLAEEMRRPPTMVTQEGDLIALCNADYTFKGNRADIAAILSTQEDIIFDGESDDDEEVLLFSWVSKGRSFREIGMSAEPGTIVLNSMNMSPDGKVNDEIIRLGQVSLDQNSLNLFCMSEERMKAGKALLEVILGSQITHHGDNVRQVKDLIESSELDDSEETNGEYSNEYWDDYSEFEENEGTYTNEYWNDGDEELIDLELRSVDMDGFTKNWLQGQMDKWLDDAIPALDGMTPRQASQDPFMRKQLIDLLKDMEFTSLNRSPMQGPGFNVSYMCKALELADEEFCE